MRFSQMTKAMPTKHKINWFKHEKRSQVTMAASVISRNCSD